MTQNNSITNNNSVVIIANAAQPGTPKKRSFETAMSAEGRGLGSFEEDYFSMTFSLFEDSRVKRRRLELPQAYLNKLALPPPTYHVPRAHGNVDKDHRFGIRPVGTWTHQNPLLNDMSFEGRSWLEHATLRLFTAPKGGIEALIDDEVDDADVAYERISSWLRCLATVDDALRRQLERDLAHPLYLSIRRSENRPEEFTEDEVELIQRYKEKQPFSVMLTYALSIVLNRPYDRIRDEWLGKIFISSSTTVADVQHGIQIQLLRLQQILQRVRKSHLGPLSQRLLKQAHKASSSRLGEEQTAAQLRQALTWEGHEGDGIAAEMKQLHSALVMPSRDRSVSQVVSSEELLQSLQRDEFVPSSRGTIRRLSGLHLSSEAPGTNFAAAFASLGSVELASSSAGDEVFKKPQAAAPAKRKPGRPRKIPQDASALSSVFSSSPQKYDSRHPHEDDMEIAEDSSIAISVAPATALPASELIDGYLDPKYVVSWDVSQGTSRLRLRCVNEIDDEKFPSNIKFLARRFFADENESDEALAFTPGCTNCAGNCKDSATCICIAEMYQHRSPYNEHGCLVNWPIGYPIYECNSNCSCGATCSNRVVQHGSLAPIEIFKTREKGWGVRATRPIAAGTYVCEYVGEIVNAEEAEKRGLYYDSIQCSYLYDLDMEEGECRYTIDAFYYGNVSRFINHCCDPNLQNYQVWIDNLDKAKPHVCLYARRDIKALEELSFDYKYEILKGGKGEQVEHIPCKCGARNCRGVLF